MTKYCTIDIYFVKNCFCLGNQRIHQLTSQGWYELRVDMSDFINNRRYAHYRIFSVGNKASGYRLTVGEYNGNAGKDFYIIIHLQTRVLLHV